ncbi:MAG TPA: hypothetical protein VNN10_01790 [Dehalococcoidia bacterium]|nr:hypothetical protein [Dehalococcoidia bacterium]
MSSESTNREWERKRRARHRPPRLSGRGLRWKGLAVLASAGVFAATLAWSAGTARAEDPPPPPLRVTVSASINFTDAPRQYDIVQALLEFAPGAATPSHRVNGRGLFTVLSGEITRVEDDGGTSVFRGGQTFSELSGDKFDVDMNRGSAPARLLATLLVQPGAEPLIINPSAPPPRLEPRFVAAARTTVGTIPAAFTLSHGILELQPGWSAALHTHDGWSIATGLTGPVPTNLVNGVPQGASFAHGPNDLHEASYAGPGVSTAMFASVGPTGAPASRPVTTGPAPAQTIRPPSTGDAGLAGSPGRIPAGILLGAALCIGLGAAPLLRRISAHLSRRCP